MLDDGDRIMPTLYPVMVFPKIKNIIPNGSGLLWSRQQSLKVVGDEAPGGAASPPTPAQRLLAVCHSLTAATSLAITSGGSRPLSNADSLLKGVAPRKSIIVGSAKNAHMQPPPLPAAPLNTVPRAWAPRGSANHSPSVESAVSGTRTSSPSTSTTAVDRRSRDDAP